MHARSTGPYSLVTQQPRAARRSSAASVSGNGSVGAGSLRRVLQEMLTVKSDDITGRTKVYENIVRGDHVIDAGMPESFNVLVKRNPLVGPGHGFGA